MKFRNIVILMIGILLIMGCSNKPEPDTILHLGKKNYSILEFFKKNDKQNFVKIPESAKIEKIESWAENELITFAAKKENFAETSENVKRELEQIKTQANIRFYLDRTILDSIITEQSLKEAYQRMGKEVNASHILIQYRDSNPKVERSQTEAISLAEKVLKKAKNGENFSELAKKYSDDKSSEDGNLGFFGWGKMVDPFQQKVFSMSQGEISDLVETRFGYHIIKLNSIKRVPMKSFEEEKDRIKNMEIKTRNQELRNAYNKRVEDLKKEYGYKLNQEIVDQIIKDVDEAKKADGTQQKSEIEYLKKLDIKEPVAYSNGKEIKLKDLIGKLENYSNRLPPSYVTARYMPLVIDNFYVTDLFLLDFEKRKIGTDKDYLKSIDDQKERIVIKEFRKELFNKDISVSEKEIEGYYEQNKEEKYMNNQRSEVREIYMEDEKEAEKLLQEVLSKQDKFDEYSEKLTERFNTKDKPGYLGKITKSQYGEIGRVADTTAANTIHPKLIKAGKGWTMIKVYQKIPPTAKELKEVESTIKRILTDKKRNENRQKVMDNLKKKYNFKIYWECVNIEK